jgi:membrane protease YdiL (CAAX protease family)
MSAHTNQESGTRRWLLAVAVLSLFITFAANSMLARALPTISGIGASCIASATAALVLYLAIRPLHPFAPPLPSTRWRRVVQWSICWLVVWLCASVAVALVQGGWHAYTAGAFAILGFVLLGPLTEELLFRGAIFELAERAYPHSPSAPILLSTILFSLYHLQIHSYEVTPFVVAQLAFTLPMGYVFAKLRCASGSLWPGFVAHVLTNLPHAFGAPPSAAY